MPEVTDEELVRRFAGHEIDHDTKERFRGFLDRELRFDRCRACGTYHEPPGPICPVCWSTDIESIPVSGRGEIHLAIFLHQGVPADGVDYSRPYPVVTVELDEQAGLRYSSTVVGAPNDEIRIGRRVVLDWSERDGAPMPVFRLEEHA